MFPPWYKNFGSIQMKSAAQTSSDDQMTMPIFDAESLFPVSGVNHLLWQPSMSPMTK
jgi:hypothetical protein